MELNNLKNEASKLRLTPTEKTAMKARIFGVPVPAHATPKQSPYFIFDFQFMHARILAPLAVVLVVFMGGSTAAAAQGALPGDLLYPVKLSINEAVEVALATTPVARAEVSVKQAVRRVEEAEVLASRGELTAETGNELAANFEVHAQSASDLADEVGVVDPAAAQTLRTKMGSSLSAHGAILATLTVGGAAANQEGAGAVAARVLARADTAPSAMVMRSAKVAPQANPATTMSMTMIASDTATASEATGTVSMEADIVEDTPIDPAQAQEAAKLKVQAQAQVEEARELFEDSKDDLAAGPITQVSTEFAAIESLMEQGSSTQATADYDIAIVKFTEALKRATKIEVLLKVQATVKQNIITPILDKNIDIESTYEIDLL